MGCLKVISTFVKKHTSERVHTLYDKEVLRHVRRQCGAEEEEIEGDVVPVHKLLQRALMVLHILALSQALSHSGDASEKSASRMLLWVDDEPKNNSKEVAKATNRFGWKVYQVVSTDRAKRPQEKAEAAKSLISVCRNEGFENTPILIFCGDRTDTLPTLCKFSNVFTATTSTLLNMFLGFLQDTEEVKENEEVEAKKSKSKGVADRMEKEEDEVQVKKEAKSPQHKGKEKKPVPKTSGTKIKKEQEEAPSFVFSESSQEHKSIINTSIEKSSIRGMEVEANFGENFEETTTNRTTITTPPAPSSLSLFPSPDISPSTLKIFGNSDADTSKKRKHDELEEKDSSDTEPKKKLSFSSEIEKNKKRKLNEAAEEKERKERERQEAEQKEREEKERKEREEKKAKEEKERKEREKKEREEKERKEQEKKEREEKERLVKEKKERERKEREERELREREEQEKKEREEKARLERVKLEKANEKKKLERKKTEVFEEPNPRQITVDGMEASAKPQKTGKGRRSLSLGFLHHLSIHTNLTRGGYKQNFNVVLKLSEEHAVDSLIVDNNDGSYTATFYPTKTGIYEVSITYNKHHIPCSPFKLEVKDGSSSKEKDIPFTLKSSDSIVYNEDENLPNKEKEKAKETKTTTTRTITPIASPNIRSPLTSPSKLNLSTDESDDYWAINPSKINKTSKGSINSEPTCQYSLSDSDIEEEKSKMEDEDPYPGMPRSNLRADCVLRPNSANPDSVTFNTLRNRSTTQIRKRLRPNLLSSRSLLSTL